MNAGRLLDTVQGCEIRQAATDLKIDLTADADIDADGANGQSGAWAYMENDHGLEALANAGYPHTSWYPDILLCNSAGKPIVTASGGIPSKTAYEWRQRAIVDPRRWVDSAAVPYAVAGSTVRRLCRGVLVGCRCRMTNLRNGKVIMGGVLDIGPAKKIGEISIAAAKALGINADPRHGGEAERIIKYEFWPGIPAVINGVTYDLLRA